MIESRSTSCWSVIVMVGQTAELAQKGTGRAAVASQGRVRLLGTGKKWKSRNDQKYDTLLQSAAISRG